MLRLSTKRNYTSLKYYGLALLVIVPVFSTLFAPATQAESFNAGRIIDDGVFVNRFSMNTAQIQAFLNSKVKICDTYGTQPSEYGGGTRAQWGQVNYGQSTFTCLKDYFEEGRSASQIIYDTAQTYSINPQVLIVLLQKEQGLVTDTWPLNIQYRSATGYGCPDTAACDSQYYGLVKQLDWSAKMFRAIMNASPTWYTPYVLGNNTIQYNRNSACGSSVVNIQNRATQALYNYTPYQPNSATIASPMGTTVNCGSYGNLNFFRYFTSWFGSTQFPQPVGGALYYQLSNGAIYLVIGTTRYYIPSNDMLVNYNLDKYPTIAATDSDIQTYTDGGVLTNLTWDSGGVYLVNKGVRYHVSPNMCTAWALSCYDNTKVRALGDSFQTQHLQQGGSLPELATYNGVNYKLSAGTRQPFADTKTFLDLGYGMSPILSASPVNMQMPLGSLLLSTPGVIQFSANSPNFYYDGSSYFQVSSVDVYKDWKLDNVIRISPPASSYTQTPPSSTLLTSWAQSNGKSYIVDQGRKILIPDNLSDLWSGASFTTQPAPLFNNLPTINLTGLVWTNPNIYYLDGKGKHYVSSVADVQALQSSTGSMINVGADKVANIPEGAPYIADGRVVSLNDGGGKIYVVNNHKLTYIPSPGIFNAYKFSWSSIKTLPTSILDEYPLDPGQGLGHSRASNGSHYIVTKSGLYWLSSRDSIDFGTVESSFSLINKQLVSFAVPSLSRFLYNVDNGRIYYASGGAIHYVTSMSAYRAYGGLKTPTTAINSAILRLFTEAQPI